MMTKLNARFDLNHCDEIGKVCTVFNLRTSSRAVTQLYEEIMRPSGTLPTKFTNLNLNAIKGSPIFWWEKAPLMR